MLRKLEILLKNEIDPAFAKRAEYILTEIERKKPKTILDVGCGRGFYVKAISLYSFPRSIYGVDINSQYIEKAKETIEDKRIVLEQGSIYNLPYKNRTFDFIICSEVLEHLSDDTKAIKEIYRLLKPGGTVAITVPNENFPFFWDPLNWLLMHIFKTHINKNIWWLAGIWADHEKLYRKEELLLIIKKQNLKIDNTYSVIHYCWPFSHFLLYGIGKNLVERFGTKQFDRFNFKDRSSSRLIAFFMRWPSIFDSKKKSSSVNTIIIANKN